MLNFEKVLLFSRVLKTTTPKPSVPIRSLFLPAGMKLAEICIPILKLWFFPLIFQILRISIPRPKWHDQWPTILGFEGQSIQRIKGWEQLLLNSPSQPGTLKMSCTLDYNSSRCGSRDQYNKTRYFFYSTTDWPGSGRQEKWVLQMCIAWQCLCQNVNASRENSLV